MLSICQTQNTHRSFSIRMINVKQFLPISCLFLLYFSAKTFYHLAISENGARKIHHHHMIHFRSQKIPLNFFLVFLARSLGNFSIFNFQLKLVKCFFSQRRENILQRAYIADRQWPWPSLKSVINEKEPMRKGSINTLVNGILLQNHHSRHERQQSRAKKFFFHNYSYMIRVECGILII